MPKQLRRVSGGLTRDLLLAVVVAVVAVALSPPAPGAAPTRYLDQVFDEVTVTRDLVYMPSEHVALDLYEPTGDPATARPAFIWKHGVPGNKGTESEVAVRTLFTHLRYVAASLNFE